MQEMFGWTQGPVAKTYDATSPLTQGRSAGVIPPHRW